MPMNVPKLALGTYGFGGAKERDPNNDDSKDVEVVKLAIHNGVSLIDTAQVYAEGKSEELIGQATKDLARSSYMVETKQLPGSISYTDTMLGVEASLKRLGVDYIDIFLCHSPDASTDLREFFKATNELHELGKIKHVGVSNFGPKMLKIAMETSDTPIVLNQVNVSPSFDDVFASGTYDFCRENGIEVQAYSVLRRLRENEKTVKVLESIAKHRDKTIEQLAIAFVNSLGVKMVIKASSQEHWDQVKEALDISLTDQEILKIKDAQKANSSKFGHLLEL